MEDVKRPKAIEETVEEEVVSTPKTMAELEKDAEEYAEVIKAKGKNKK